MSNPAPPGVSATRVLQLTVPVDLGQTLAPLRRGPGDPCVRTSAREVLRATRTPHGAATMRLEQDSSGKTILAEAWGPGSEWALEHVPDLVGANDDDEPFAAVLDGPDFPGQGALRELRKRFMGLRMFRTLAVVEALIPTILEQKVTGVEAHRAYRGLVLAFGELAPGPAEMTAGLMVPPSPHVLAAQPYWAYHRFGIERKRADTIRLVCSYASRLEKLTASAGEDARQGLISLPGIGPWSAAEVAVRALGDPDAVSVGDYHLPHQVAWVLTGAARGDDDTMLQLLEPVRGQRGRAIRLIEASGKIAPRRGPRMPIRSIRDI